MLALYLDDTLLFSSNISLLREAEIFIFEMFL